MKNLLFFVMVFMGGFTASINMTRLLPTSPNYDASWFKVAFAVILAVIGWCMSRQKESFGP